MKEKRKNSEHSSLSFSLQCIFIALTPITFAIIASMLFTSLISIESSYQYDESFLLIINGDEVATENEYSGYVSISVKGIVEQDSKFVQDTHYIKVTSTGSIKYFDGFYIDGIGNGERLRFSVFPQYNADGEYEFLQYIGDTPHPVTFQILNDNISQNIVFEIKIAEGNIIHTGR